MLLLSFCKYWPFLLVAIKSFTVFSFSSFEHMFYNVCIYFISTKHSNFLQCTRCSSSLICGGERIHSLSRVYFWDFGRSLRLLYQSFDRRCPKVCAIYECCYSGWLDLKSSLYFFSYYSGQGCCLVQISIARSFKVLFLFWIVFLCSYLLLILHHFQAFSGFVIFLFPMMLLC